MDMQTPNMADENLKKLMDLFPNIVTETIDEEGNVVRAIDKDKLEQEISTKVIEGKAERYEFTWPEKKLSVLNANAPTTNTLRPCVEESVNFDTTKNLYIEGDNLEVLKILQETYLSKVKMIYIDPPYNTGSDFVYEDDFAEDMDEYKEKSGQLDEEGNRLKKNLESNGRFHTDWLNMIYKRLKLARNFLSDDGMIFISIDDNEQSNLKKICDEIFGEINFITQFVWEKTAHFGRQKNNSYCNSEYILVYSKSLFDQNGVKEMLVEKIKNELEDAPLYNASNPLNVLEFKEGSVIFNIEDGVYKESTDNKFQLLDEVKVKNGINVNSFRIKMRSRWSQDKVIQELSNGCRYLVKSNKFSIRVLYNKDKFSKESLKQIIFTNRNNPLCTYDRFNNKVDTNNEATKNLNELIGNDVFDYPKPISLIKYFISALWNNEKEAFIDDGIFMDFFSGSASTAHAVMQLNAEDGGNRQFIMVQLQEKTNEKSEAYKAGYKNICEIGKERIRRAGKKIKEDFKDQEGIEDLDIGFRVLKVDSSNMEDIYYNPLELQQDMLSSMHENIKKDRNDLDLLFQVMLDLGIEISSKIDEFSVDGKRCYSVEDDFLIACFDKNIDTDLVKEIARKKPSYAVITDRSMHDDSLLTNFEQIFKEISPDTVRKVL